MSPALCCELCALLCAVEGLFPHRSQLSPSRAAAGMSAGD